MALLLLLLLMPDSTLCYVMLGKLVFKELLVQTKNSNKTTDWTY